MTVLFTPYRVYMTVIHIQILRYPLITSFELNPHLKRAHVLLSVISINTKMSSYSPVFWNQLLLPKLSPRQKLQIEGRLSCFLPIVGLGLLHRISPCHPTDTRSPYLMQWGIPCSLSSFQQLLSDTFRGL